MSAAAIIPARLGSTRLPNKVLADLSGHPMIWHVWNRVSQATCVDAVYIATDTEQVRAVAEGWGAQVLMTGTDCRSGTERVAACLSRVKADLILNIQGDEPLVAPSMLDALVERWDQVRSDLITPVYRIAVLDDLLTSNIVKVARTAAGQALYFSRSPIPFVRDMQQDEWLQHHTFWGHVGVYGYRPDVLARYPELPVSRLEAAEQLEQIRFLEAGYRIQTVETTYQSIAVDVAADLERVRALLLEDV